MKRERTAARAGLLAAAATALVPAAVLTQGGGPDLVVHELFETRRWGEVAGVSAYSIGTEICNRGSQTEDWVGETNRHPVIAQNLYRMRDGRLEQIGMSWVKHGFSAVNGNACGLGCQRPPGGSDELGVGCSDPYDAGLNGNQGGFGQFIGGGLGPRSEIQPATGQFPYPYGHQGESGDAVYKRLQVANSDLDPAQNAGALYFIEAHYIARGDALAGNDDNNASYRQVTVAPDLTLDFAGPTVEGRAAILAWGDQDPQVEVADLDIPGDGRFTLASKASDLGGGLWRYEYALYNMNSHRAAAAFGVLVPPGVTLSAVGFHDVSYHSGEPFDGTDWIADVPPVGGGPLVWATNPFGVDPAANALRWGTTYNFRFDADAPPGTTRAALRLFRPGQPGAVTLLTTGPAAAR